MQNKNNKSFWEKHHLKILVISLVLALVSGIYLATSKTSILSPFSALFTSSENSISPPAQAAEPIAQAITNEPKQTESLPKSENKTTTAEIVSVGDIFLHSNNLDAAYDSKTKTYKFDPIFEPVADYLKNADLTTAWLGGVYDEKGPYSYYPLFKSPATLLDTLQNIGMDVAFRTNHTMDYGTKGFNATSELLKQHGISQIAAATTEEESKKIFYFEKENLKIAIVGYIYGMNGIPIPKPWMINLIDQEKIKNDIAKAKENADFVIVGLHFGNEYERVPSNWQKETVQEIADNGADLIIGSHVHVIQTVEEIKTKDNRQVFVAYGLGNFYCGQRMRYSDAGVILKYVIEKDATGTRLKEIKYLSTWVAEYTANGKITDQILPSKKYIGLYENKQASFLSPAKYDRLKQSYNDTVKHLDNPEIGFTEFSE